MRNKEELIALHEAVQKLETRLNKRLTLEEEIEEIQESLPEERDAIDSDQILYGAGAVNKYIKALRNNLSVEQANFKKANKDE